MATLFWVIWQERDVFIFEWKGMDNIEELWDRVHLLASLWASVYGVPGFIFFVYSSKLGGGFKIGFQRCWNSTVWGWLGILLHHSKSLSFLLT